MFRGHQARPHFSTPLDRPVPDVSLASCDKIEELRALLPTNKNVTRYFVNLLSSITSRKLRKISLSFIEFINDGDSDSDSGDDDWDDGDDGVQTWGTLDMTLGRLAEQVSKAENKLILQLNVRPSIPKPVKFDQLLSQFLECGVLDINYN